MKNKIHIERTKRVQEVENLYDLPKTEVSVFSRDVDVDLSTKSWRVGVVVGAPGTGKTSFINRINGVNGPKTPATIDYRWSDKQSILDDFPEDMSTEEIVSALNAVGLTSTESWVRPYRVLSTSEQRKAVLARYLSRSVVGQLVCIDDLTGLYAPDSAVAGVKALLDYTDRRGVKVIITVSNYNVVPFIQPDWVLELDTSSFRWRSPEPQPPLDWKFEASIASCGGSLGSITTPARN